MISTGGHCGYSITQYVEEAQKKHGAGTLTNVKKKTNMLPEKKRKVQSQHVAQKAIEMNYNKHKRNRNDTVGGRETIAGQAKEKRKQNVNKI